MNIAVSLKSILSLILFFSLASNLHATQNYVIDDLSAFIHSGPGSNFRIIGAVKSGDMVDLTSTAEANGYQEIITKTKTGWLNAKLLSTSPGLAFQLEKTQTMLVNAQADSKNKNKKILARNAELESEVNDKSNEIEKLKMQLSDSEKELLIAQEQAQLLQGKLDNLDESTKMRWLSYGGSWALLWLFLGIVLPRISWKKKKSDRWM